MNKFSRLTILSKILWLLSPPHDFGTIPVIHKTSEWYKIIYRYSSKIPKKDRFGIYLKIEQYTLELMDFLLTAALEDKDKKQPHLRAARLKAESIKRLLRLCYEIGIVDMRHYINFEYHLQEISKDINKWIGYDEKKRAPSPVSK